MHNYSELQVLESSAGFYIGRYYNGDGYSVPGNRESKYFPTKEVADNKLKNGFEIRNCMESDIFYKEHSNIAFDTLNKSKGELTLWDNIKES